MFSDSIPNSSIAMASSNPKDFLKKKRANRSAKLKQSKVEARRQQWLSQVKNKGGCMEKVSDDGNTHGRASVCLENKRSTPVAKLEIKPRCQEETYEDGSPMNHFSDFESWPSNSPNSHTSSLLGSNDSWVIFTASVSSVSGRSRSSISNGCYSESVSEDDEGEVVDDDCLDDWEVVADALAAAENKQQAQKPDSKYGLRPSEKQENAKPFESQLGRKNEPCSVVNVNSDKGGPALQRSPAHRRAWTPDDASRPQTLPSMSKQCGFPFNSEQRPHRGRSHRVCSNVGSVPTSCPICFEDLDFTDSNFHPCSCGFRLCLFCHKRIIEQDARCPGCRKQYDHNPVEGEAILDVGSLTFRFGNSFSMKMKP